MKIIFICKRYYTGKDVIRHSFGRLYELPTQLARLGHRVTVLCLDYRNIDPQDSFVEQFDAGSVHWAVVPLRSLFSLKAFSTYKTFKSVEPNLVIGSSDIPCLWLAKKLAGRFKTPYIVDLYDNYESFGQAKVPGFRNALKNSVNKASTVIAVSEVLKEKVFSDYAPQGQVIVMNNGVACNSFFVGNKVEAKLALGLPTDMKLIGTAGNLSRMKGLDTVYDAWAKIEQQTENVCLVLAGPVEDGLPVPTGSRVYYLGELLEQQVGQLFCSLDVGIIPAHDSEFGRYCFPQKLYEMVACDLPVVAAKVGAIADILQETPAMLFTAGNADSLVSTITAQLNNPSIVSIKPMEWPELVKDIEPAIMHITNKEH